MFGGGSLHPDAGHAIQPDPSLSIVSKFNQMPKDTNEPCLEYQMGRNEGTHVLRMR